MTDKKKYQRPELKVVDLSFNQDMLGKCHTPSFPTPIGGSPVEPCAISYCLTTY